MRILVLNGINLNALGSREPGIYGTTTLQAIEEKLQARAKELEVDLACFQTNMEGEMVNYIQREASGADGILINPGAWTHYSIGIRDALSAAGKPFVEVHLSNVYAREAFRHTSLLVDVAQGQVSGLGWRSYLAALDGLVGLLRERV